MQVLKSMASAVFLGALLFAAPMAHADDATAHGHSHKGWHWDKFDRLKKQLDLSDDQVERLRAADKGQGEKDKLLKDRLKADEAGLAVLVDEKASEGELKAGLKALEQDHKAQMERAQKRMDLYKDVLTPMQQAKLVVMMLGRKHGQCCTQSCKGPRGGQGGWGGPHPGWMHGDKGGDKMHGHDGGMKNQDQSGSDQSGQDNGGGADASGD